SAYDTDRLESDVVLVRKGRRKQHASLDGHAQTWFVLKYALLQDPFHEQPGIRDLELRTRLHGKLGNGFPVCHEAIVQNEARRRNRVVAARMIEIEVPQLDFKFPWIGDGGVGRDERPICPSPRRKEQDHEQRGGELNRSRPRRRTSSTRVGPFPAPPARTLCGSAGRRQGCESSARPGHPAAS